MSPRRRVSRRLPESKDELRGLRYAVWLRESTEGQFERYGPDAQMNAIRRAAARLGVVESGLTWRVAASGRTVHSSDQFQAMLASARAGEFRVLVCAYVSRFQRNLRMTLNSLEEELHPAGVAVYFADEDILSSDPRDQDQLEREAQEAGAYSRKLSRRVADSYAERRARGEPGGRPPFGFRREGNPPVLTADPDNMAVLQRVFALSASGFTDHEVAQQTGLKKTHVAELLTSRFYIGNQSDRSRRPAVNEPTTRDQVHPPRGTYARRHSGPATRRTYLLSALIRCKHCGRALTGHSGRYRHVDACEPFKAARPRLVRAYSHASDRRTKGESYPIAVYDGVIPEAIAKISANAKLITEVQEAMDELSPAVDRLTLTGIEKERDAAIRRYRADRDLMSLEATMRRLDQEEADARDRPGETPPRGEVVAALQDLCGLYLTAQPETQRRIVQSLVEKVEVSGVNEVWLYPSEEAVSRGWGAAFTGEFRCSIGQYGRGERI